jgi:Protein of unknown function (DUF2488)
MFAQLIPDLSMTTYYYAVASERFLFEEEPFSEVIKERQRYYREQEKEINFWVVHQPAFLDAPELAEVKARCPQPAAAIISTDKRFVSWLKLRLEYVATGEFEAPSPNISDPFASLAPAA